MEPTTSRRDTGCRPSTVLELRRTSGTRGLLDDSAEVEQLIRPASERRLLCRVCGEAITADDHRIPIEGRHVHRRVNPAGFEFEFGCFDAAPGAIATGKATTEFSWFAGYTWVFAICRRCGTHLGWFFEGGDPRFYGLVLNRLEEEKPEFSGE